MRLLRGFILLYIILAISNQCDATIRIGLDKVDSYKPLFENKRVGIIANHTAFNSSGKSILEVFRDMDNVTVTALFGPEHGFTGLHQAGEKVESVVNANIPPVYSLYGKHNKPTPEMLDDVDVLVFDIQDIGTRYYTYIYTMAYAMESAAENSKPFIVLDRPNPINAVDVQGNLLEKEFVSPAGLYPIAIRHGMTVGELAMLFNGQGWLGAGLKADLTVIPMTGYQRDLWYDQTGLKFIKPSPNMTSIDAAIMYPGTCLLEGTNISEGRGTDSPFLLFGAPWIDASKLTARLNALGLDGIRFEPAEFTPSFSKHSGTLCRGSRIVIVGRHPIDSFWAGIHCVAVLYQMYPDQFEWKAEHFDHLCGTDKVRNAIVNELSLEPLKKVFQKDIEDFKKLRQRYLLY